MNIKFLFLFMLSGLFILPVKAQSITSTATLSVSPCNCEAPAFSSSQIVKDATPMDSTIQLISDDRITVLRSDSPGKKVVLNNAAKARKKYFSCPDVVPNLCAPVKEAPLVEAPPTQMADKKVEIVNPVKGKPFFLPDPVFFRINKWVIDATEWEKIEKAVDVLNKNPEATVVVTGYADKKTGNTAINLRLSKNRSEAVAKALQTKYGISKNRISINWKGDGLQPFQLENDKNRAVLFLINP